MKKPILKNYTGLKKKVQEKLYSKRVRREGKAMPSIESKQKNQIREPGRYFSFFESIKYYTVTEYDKQDKTTSSDEYHFKCTRKGYIYYGIVIQIFRNGESCSEQGFQKIYETNEIVVLSRKFDSESVEDPTYYYDDLHFYFKNSAAKIGDYITTDLYKIIKREIHKSVFSYFQEESFALFCSLESIPFEKEYLAILLGEFYFYCSHLHKSFTDWGYHGSVKIIDIQHYGKGINGDVLFANFPLSLVKEEGNIQILSPSAFGDEIIIRDDEHPKCNSSLSGASYHQSAYWLNEDVARILKVSNFKNSGHSYWFIYLIEDPIIEDNFENLYAKFQEIGVNLKE
jgi:hypothetical protein